MTVELFFFYLLQVHCILTSFMPISGCQLIVHNLFHQYLEKKDLKDIHIIFATITTEHIKVASAGNPRMFNFIYESGFTEVKTFLFRLKSSALLI